MNKLYLDGYGYFRIVEKDYYWLYYKNEMTKYEIDMFSWSNPQTLILEYN